MNRFREGLFNTLVVLLAIIALLSVARWSLRPRSVYQINKEILSTLQEINRKMAVVSNQVASLTNTVTTNSVVTTNIIIAPTPKP